MKPPQHLSEKSTQVWQDIERLKSRELNKADYAIIEQLCNELDLYDEAVEEIRKTGFTNKHDQVNPSVSVRNKAAANIRQLYKAVTTFTKEEAQQKSKLRSVKNF